MEATTPLDEMLIRESEMYLDGYHIALSKYTASVNRNCGLPIVYFTSGNRKITVSDCYCEDGEFVIDLA